MNIKSYSIVFLPITPWQHYYFLPVPIDPSLLSSDPTDYFVTLCSIQSKQSNLILSQLLLFLLVATKFLYIVVMLFLIIILVPLAIIDSLITMFTREFVVLSFSNFFPPSHLQLALTSSISALKCSVLCPHYSSFRDSCLALPEDKEEGGRVKMVGSRAKRMETQDERQRSDRLMLAKCL